MPWWPEALLGAGAVVLAARPRGWAPATWPAVLAPAAALVALGLEPALGLGPLRALDVVVVAGMLAAGLLGQETGAPRRLMAPLLLSTAGLLLLASATRLEAVGLAFLLVVLPPAWSLRASGAPDAGRYAATAVVAGGLLALGLGLIATALGGPRLDVLAPPAGVEGPALADLGLLCGVGLVLGALGLTHLLGAAPLGAAWAPLLSAAPAPLVAWLTISAPAGAMALLARVLTAGAAPDGSLLLPGLDPGAVITVTGLLAVLAARLAARGEADLGRLVATQAAGSAGWALVALGALGPAARPALDPATPARALALLAVSALLAHAGLAALLAASDRELGGRGLERWLGAGKRNRWLSLALVLLLASAAGAPPTLGFVARVHVLSATLSAGHVVVAAALAVDLALGLALFLRVTRVTFIGQRPPDPFGPPAVEPLVTTPALTVVAVVLAFLSLALGPVPDGLVRVIG